MDKSFRVVGIFRAYGLNRTFVMVVYSDKLEYFKVDKSMSEKLSQGFVFIGDRIRITQSKPEGIVFSLDRTNEDEELEENDDEIVVYNIGEKIQVTNGDKPINYLPYLCDILPYSNTPVPTVDAKPVYNETIFLGKYKIGNLEVPNISIPLPQSFVARIIQKTRINMYPNTYNPFFFVIASSGNHFVKIVFWLENLNKYSSLKVGDIIYVKEYKNRKKLPFIDRIEQNTFTESVYFDCEEVTAKSLEKIIANKKTALKPLFETIEGKITYISILMRYNLNSFMMDYVLCKVDGECIVLFYNSDNDFYKLRDGVSLRISELKKVNRAGMIFYVSTIYTQFSILDEDEENSKRHQSTIIFGAIGYVPDNFDLIDEIIDYNRTEKVRNHDVSVNLFMKPTVSTIEEVKDTELIANESKKFIVDSKIIKIAESELSVDYTENSENKKQRSWKITLESGFEIYHFDNFFFDSDGKSNIDSIRSMMDKKSYIAIEVLRVDADVVLPFLTENLNFCYPISSMNSRTEKYHESLFSIQEEASVELDSTPVIPQNSIYDSPIQYQLEPKEKYVTVFGFTTHNRTAVLDQIRKLVSIEKKEDGKNYFNIWADDPSELDNLLSLNYKTINGELIGVFRRNFGLIEDKDVYSKKKGVFTIFKEYLFGE